MRKLVPVALAAVVLLALTGCANQSTDIKDVAAAREQCHDLGGVFTADQGLESRVYFWECDLSDNPKED